MTTLLTKTFIFLKRDGFLKTLHKILIKPIYVFKYAYFKKRILAQGNIEDRFTSIYKINFWSGVESVSGGASTLEYTKNLRDKLPGLFDKLSIKLVFDAPCGDFYWMRHVIKNTNLEYIGGDIVLPIIESLNENYRNERTRFIHIDLTKEKFPVADVMICRDCLIHLSYADTRLLLQNFVESNIPYLLTTTFINSNHFQNRDIATSDCRYIDLFSAPYNFPKDVIYRIEDWVEPYPKREMCLWSRDQVVQVLSKFP
jgi:hypothetical protein